MATEKSQTAKKPTPKQSEAYAAGAYKKFTATVRWEDHQAEYYASLKKWALTYKKVEVPNDVDQQIQKMFSNIKAIGQTDPLLADQERLKLYGALTRAWAETSDTLPDTIQNDIKMRTLSVTTTKGARELQGYLLGTHLMRERSIDPSVEHAEHYGYFSAVVFDKAQRKDYHTDPQAWWLVYDVLYNSWLKKMENDAMAPPPPMAPWEEQRVATPPPPPIYGHATQKKSAPEPDYQI